MDPKYPGIILIRLARINSKSEKGKEKCYQRKTNYEVKRDHKILVKKKDKKN